ncbi:MAG: chromosomal replication initiator protein DnaA [Firmicutes bacterium]|nr:chromosomal replication initiator protein DnaA [Bacillota bacterium]
MELQKVWNEALYLLSGSFIEVVYNSWIKTLIPVSLENGCMTLKTEMDFFKDTINQRYLFEITRCVSSVLDQDVDVVIVSDKDLSEDGSKPSAKKNTYQSNLKQKYIFENFVKGKSNELAYAASLAVAEAPGESSYNPLFLYGAVGLGKTHLMHSIGNFVLEQNPEMKVCYVSMETFTNEFISAIRQKDTEQFKAKYRGVDVLLLDDIQFLTGKEETQEELFHTFNVLYNDNKQIVLTSDQPPKELKSLETRLTNRFTMGLIVDITLPDFETRTAILEKKAYGENLSISGEIIRFIAKNIASNIRDLEGALNRVAALSRLNHAPITMELAQTALRDIISGIGKPEITVGYIQEVVADYYGLTVDDLTGKKRTQNIAYPRQIAMYLSRKILPVPLTEVGNIFGGRDHSTVIHGFDKISNDLENDQNLRNVIFELEKRIKCE